MIKLLLALFVICTLAKAETSPDYDGLSRPTALNETSGKVSSQITTSEFLAVTQSYQQLEGLFNGILLFSQNGVSEALPKASEQFLKLLSQKATA
ncbi:MAG: hypothetical protein H3C47_15645, partial [Candidatus Cloacimonetes bacterium]|nr:hypothetical protein [Candidatus Cloacimonadota bacterium]